MAALGGLWVAWLLSWLLASRWSSATRSRQSGVDEERVMTAAFGERYAAYRAEVPALVPRPW